MRVLETARTIDLPDPRAWVLGDLHGNSGWVQTLFPAMRRHDSQVTTVLQLGDYGFDFPAHGTSPVDYWARKAGIERVLCTLGNHESWGVISAAQGEAPGLAIRVSDVVWVLPRPARFTLGGRTVLSLGGAASLDRHLRTEGSDWFPDEAITDAMVDEAIADGNADLMLTHECGLTTVPEAERVIAANPHHFPHSALDASRASRERVERVREAVRPRLHAHGHLHVYGERELPDGRRIVAVNRDTMAGNAVMLDLATLTYEPLSLAAIRGWRV